MSRNYKVCIIWDIVESKLDDLHCAVRAILDA